VSNRSVHGGEHALCKRKTARPFSSRKLKQFVMRATKAKGPMALCTSKNAKNVSAVVKKRVKASDIRIYQFSNNGNHLHILLRSKHKRDIQNFLRYEAAAVIPYIQRQGQIRNDDGINHTYLSNAEIFQFTSGGPFSTKLTALGPGRVDLEDLVLVGFCLCSESKQLHSIENKNPMA
jgi:REP element-mobilizing transposase RayT